MLDQKASLIADYFLQTFGGPKYAREELDSILMNVNQEVFNSNNTNHKYVILLFYLDKRVCSGAYTLNGGKIFYWLQIVS